MTIPANNTENIPIFQSPKNNNPMVYRKKYKVFNIDEETFNKFENGRIKFSKWSKFLNIENEFHQKIKQCAINEFNKGTIIVLRNLNNGLMRSLIKVNDT
jgi:hypothetical protein